MEIRINKDIRKFKTKDIGSFSFKEAGFAAAGMAAGYGTYMIVKYFFPKTGIDESIPIALIPMTIILAFGFFKPFGMSMTQFIKTFVREYFLTPQIYVWENDYETDFEKIEDIWGEDYKYSPKRIELIASDFKEPSVLSKEEQAAKKKRQEEVKKMQIF